MTDAEYNPCVPLGLGVSPVRGNWMGDQMGRHLLDMDRETIARYYRAWLHPLFGTEEETEESLEALGLKGDQLEFAQAQRRAFLAVLPAISAAFAEAALNREFVKPLTELWNADCADAYITPLLHCASSDSTDTIDPLAREQFREVVAGFSQQFTFGAQHNVGDAITEIDHAISIAAHLGCSLPEMLESEEGVQDYVFHRFSRDEYVAHASRRVDLQVRAMLNATLLLICPH